MTLSLSRFDLCWSRFKSLSPRGRCLAAAEESRRIDPRTSLLLLS